MALPATGWRLRHDHTFLSITEHLERGRTEQGKMAGGIDLMSGYEFDFFVVGGGSGGVRAARIAGGLGARVGLCEMAQLGGTCVNLGCVPKKLMVYASQIAESVEDAAGFGWSIETPRFDWSTLIANKDREIGRLNGIYDRLLKGAGVEVIEGRGRLVGPHSVDVDGRVVTAERILLCPGGWPSLPDIPGVEHGVTSNEIFHLKQCPKRILIVGGGYIATEFAGIFNGLGSEVVQVYRGPLFMRGFDEDIRRFLAAEMRKKGVDLRFDCNVTALDKQGTGFRADFIEGASESFDCVFFATGRKPRTTDLGLSDVGVKTDAKGAIVVDDDFQTSVPSVYAVGDVIDRMALTPIALAEGMILAKRLFAQTDREMNYENVPTAVFSTPNIGTVGLSENDARKRGIKVVVYTSSFRPMKHTMSGRNEKTFMKLVVDAATERVLGCHMVGPDAGEVIQGFGVALNCGATKSDFDLTMGIHPTTAEEFVTMRTPRSDSALPN
jgi:glutathione reductase (NADPH)